MLDVAISRQNVFNQQFRLEPLIKRIPSMDAAQVEQAGFVDTTRGKTQFDTVPFV